MRSVEADDADLDFLSFLSERRGGNQTKRNQAQESKRTTAHRAGSFFSTNKDS
jgi:hypothetical protein